MLINPKVKKISFINYEKFFLPIIKREDFSSLIFYKLETELLTISTFIQGFIIYTEISVNQIKNIYEEKQIDIISLDEEKSQTINDDELLMKFNSDFMDGRGIEEQ